MRSFLITYILAGLVALTACDADPMVPNSPVAPTSPPSFEAASGTVDETELQTLTERLSQGRSPTADDSVQIEREIDQVRALVEALRDQLAPGGGSDGGGGDGGGMAPPTLTISDAGVSPTEIRISSGERVQIVNNSSRNHEIQSNPHPFHTDCPPMNQAGLLVPGASGMTGVFDRASTCGFHDHQNPTDSTLHGQVVTDGGSTDGGGGGNPYARGR